METGDKFFQKIKALLQRGDFDVKVSAGFIVSAPLGTLLLIREKLEEFYGREAIYGTISGRPLYIVHWNDLTEDKKRQIEGRKTRNE